MKFFIVILLFSFFKLNCAEAQETKQASYRVLPIAMPPSKSIHTSFNVNELGQIFVPINGGIYLPADSMWYIPPSKEYYFTSFALYTKDTGLFVFANSLDSSELFYLKNSYRLKITRHSMLKLEKGIYHLILKNDVCYIWGYTSRNSNIGILINNEIKWLIKIKGIINQVQINDSSKIFFALDKSILELTSRRKFLTIDSNIYGFAFNKKGEVILSCSEGIGLVEKNNLSIFAKNINGRIEINNENIYVLPLKGNTMYRLTNKIE